jgi:peptide/nickel transport system substrate-binding protein
VGIGAHGDTLTIRLIRPAPDLAARLALTYFCAVPPQTQIVRDGLAQPIPSAGPYYVATYLPDDALVVKRNPNYQGARPQRLDAMVYEFGVKAAESVRSIQRGEADVLEDYSMGPKGPLQSRYGRARDGQPQRFFLPAHLGTVYLAFNTRRGLFAERRMRRAVNFALDRPVIAATYGYLPADHYLPPGMPGHARADVFPTDGPDLARARALTRGRGGRAVLYTCDVAFCKEWAQMIRRDLARIGIDVKTRQFPDPIARARRTGARTDMLLTKMTASWPSSYPDPVTFLANVLETPGSADRIRRAVAAYCNCGTPGDWYDNAKLEARLERIGRLGGVRREAAAGALDVDLARDAPGAVLATETTSAFFSERVGCQTFQPLYFGVDIAALCLRKDS